MSGNYVTLVPPHFSTSTCFARDVATLSVWTVTETGWQVCHTVHCGFNFSWHPLLSSRQWTWYSKQMSRVHHGKAHYFTAALLWKAHYFSRVASQNTKVDAIKFADLDWRQIFRFCVYGTCWLQWRECPQSHISRHLCYYSSQRLVRLGFEARLRLSAIEFTKTTISRAQYQYYSS